MLITSDILQKDGSPHLVVTSIGYATQKNPGAVEFDYDSVYSREDNYSDVAGFYHTHPSGLNRMSSIDIETMTQWVQCLGKSLVCIIETDQHINGWLFSRDEITNEIIHREVSVETSNDVQYDLWINSDGEPIFNPVDFLVDGLFSDEDEEMPSIFDEISNKLTKLEAGQHELNDKFIKLTTAIQQVVLMLGKDE